MEIFLLLLAPLAGLGYAVLDYTGIWDRCTRRDKALEGLRRLRSIQNYPDNSVGVDTMEDRSIFKSLFSRVKKRTRHPKLEAFLQKGYKPCGIARMGGRLSLPGISPQLPESERYFVSDSLPVAVLFPLVNGETDYDQMTDMGWVRVGTLHDLDDWLKEEESRRKFWVGTVMIGILSISLILLRTCLKAS